MAATTVLFGVILIVLGAAGYFSSGMASVTALIPAFFGIVLAVLGLLGAAPSRRKLMMHIAMLVALLGAIGAGMQASKAFRGEDPFEFSLGFGSQAGMAVLCVILLVVGIRSFIDARKSG